MRLFNTIQMKKITTILSSIILFSTSCNSPKETKEIEKITTPKYVTEAHSYAQPNNAVVKHLNLDIDVDFLTTWQTKSNLFSL